MKIKELLEQTVAPVPPGQASGDNPTTPTEGPPNTSNTPKITQPTGTAPTTQTPTTGQSKPTLGNQQPQVAAPGPGQPGNPNTPQAGKPMGQPAAQPNPQQQQDQQQLTQLTQQLQALQKQQQSLQQKLGQSQPPQA